MPRINFMHPECPQCEEDDTCPRSQPMAFKDIHNRTGEYKATEYYCNRCGGIWHTLEGTDFAVEGHVPFRK